MYRKSVLDLLQDRTSTTKPNELYPFREVKVLILKHETTNIVVKPLPNFEVRGEMNEIEYIGKSNRCKEIFCKKKPFTWPTHGQKYFYYF